MTGISIKEHDRFIRIQRKDACGDYVIYVEKDGGLEELKAAIEQYEKEQEEKRNKPDFKPGDIVRLTGERWQGAYPELADTLQVITSKNADGYPVFQAPGKSAKYVGRFGSTDWGAELVGRVTESEDN